jgi:hypothetical protein
MCSSPNFIQVIQWVGHVARTGVMVRNGIYTGCRRGNLQGRAYFEEAGVDCGILKQYVRTWIGFIWLSRDKWRVVATTVSIKCGVFLNQPRNRQFLKHSAARSDVDILSTLPLKFNGP